MSDLDFKILKKKVKMIRDHDPVLSPSQKLGLVITMLRNESHLTQMELSSRTGLSRCSIANIEGGNANPSFTVLCKIAEGIDIPVSQIFLLMEAM